ncbi:pre-mRNA-splicing factor CWC22-like protein [Anopheles sinensis]|uniref:Pre-mRNA-splicing factor CWC22-like protein n=1 Tax=Anopheles sinensis TaxID=74873 RepID=A0A084WUI5_ANOSI|nr:pre-mRNA-splicing factor CWC22-like protein [Anopheles sinensis]
MENLSATGFFTAGPLPTRGHLSWVECLHDLPAFCIQPVPLPAAVHCCSGERTHG